jgi:tRNA modification GTPase
VVPANAPSASSTRAIQTARHNPNKMRAVPGAMLARLQDPIVAIATAPGRGAVGIVRASGRDLRPLIDAVCARHLLPRMASYGPFLAADGGVIDQGLALHFPTPHSYTGEDVLELQAHGGPVVLQLLLARCLQALPGARVADPGEFTQRAYLNDKLDLAQAEAVADLIDASTEAAARSAGRSLSGAFSTEVQADARGQLDAIDVAVRGTLARARQGALLREGLQVVLAGQPNVGKSSLLNALAGAELAIVTAVPGTTRDKVSQTIQIEGVPLHVIDTAGLRGDDDTGDEVERIGIGRSWAAIAAADAVIFLHDLTRRGAPDYEAAEATIAARLPVGIPLLQVFNKVDAVPGADKLPDGSIGLSARTGEGLDALRQALLERAGWQATTDGLFTARARHVDALQRTQAHLTNARSHLQDEAGALDLLAEDLRQAHDALGEITGAMTADELLGTIFGSFCIGK